MRTDDTGFKLRPGAADGLGMGVGEQIRSSWTAVSQSGQERSRLFLNRGDGQFRDVSGVACVDSPADGRSFAILDYDRDGWNDIVVVNSNAPATEFYSNRLGEAGGETSANGVIALRFVGAHVGPEPTTGKSPRDGYGALATVDLGDTRLVREYRCGEGFAAQNSSTMLIGIGARERAETVSVRWPSGVVHELTGVPAGTLVTAYEDGSSSPTGEAFATGPYGSARSSKGGAEGGPKDLRDRMVLPGVASGESAPALALYSTMATWCASCRAELPELAHLRSVFSPDELAMYGVPIDEDASPSDLRAYVEEHSPAYEMLLGLSADVASSVQERVSDATSMRNALPASILTDSGGTVLLVQLGAPSVSDLRRYLAGAAR